MIPVSEIVYNTVTKSILRNNPLIFRSKSFQEPLTFVRID